MPTMITDSRALPKVRSAGSRPAENQIAEVISMLLPVGRLTSTSCPMPVTTPAPVKAMTWRQKPEWVAASRIFAFAEGQTHCWTVLRTKVSAAALTPAPMPIRTTAIQNRLAAG